MTMKTMAVALLCFQSHAAFGFNETSQGIVQGTMTVVGGEFNVGTSTFAIKDGRVGIATGSPDEEVLDVNGRIRVRAAAQPTTPTNATVLYSSNVAGTIELYVMNSAGTRTQLSSHNFEYFEPGMDCVSPWSFRSDNAFLGKSINVDMCKLAMLIEKLTGEKIIYVRDIPGKSWKGEQQARRKKRKAEIKYFVAEEKRKRKKSLASIAAWKKDKKGPRPRPYSIRKPPPEYKMIPPPKWMRDRGVR